MKIFESEILFNGYYGQMNSGDDAFVEVTSWAAKNIWKTEKFRYLAKKENLPETIEKIYGYPFSLPKSYVIQNKLLIHQSKVLVSAGGSTFHNIIRKGTIKDFALQRKLKDSRFKIGGIGVSVGPFSSVEAEQNVVKYLQNLDFLTLRDRRSHDFVKTLDFFTNLWA